MIQFYAPDFEKDGTLPELESGHCVRVLRKQVGDKIYVIDGKGNRFEAEITEAHHKHVKAQILSKEQLPNHWGMRIVLAVAPTKNIDRMEWLLEKATEIGVDEIVMLKCEHSERKNVKTERLEKIIVSAMKQSLKGVMPLLRDMTDMKTLVAQPFSGQKFICYCADDVEKKLLTCEYDGQSDVMILIGPEGDFSPAEVRLALDAGFVPVSLGDSRLRTETAALFSVQTVHVLSQMQRCPTSASHNN